MPNSCLDLEMAIEKFNKETGLWELERVVEEAHSFTKQFAEIMMQAWRSQNAPMPTGVTDTGSTSRTLDEVLPNVAGQWLDATAAVNDDTKGIIVGIGTTTPNQNDIKIATIIADGTTSGKLDYKSMNFPDTQVQAITGGYRARFNRAFENLSGGTITIQEVALYVTTSIDPSGSATFCVLRDLMNLVLNNNDLKRVEYRFDFLV